jgi:hypothetical protein
VRQSRPRSGATQRAIRIDKRVAAHTGQRVLVVDLEGQAGR